MSNLVIYKIKLTLKFVLLITIIQLINNKNKIYNCLPAWPKSKLNPILDGSVAVLS